MKSKQNILLHQVCVYHIKGNLLWCRLLIQVLFFYRKRDLPCCSYETVMTSFPQRCSWQPWGRSKHTTTRSMTSTMVFLHFQHILSVQWELAVMIPFFRHWKFTDFILKIWEVYSQLKKFTNRGWSYPDVLNFLLRCKTVRQSDRETSRLCSLFTKNWMRNCINTLCESTVHNSWGGAN